MTNSKAILGISFAAIFAVAMIFAPNAEANNAVTHLDVKSASLTVEDDGTATATLTAATAIDKNGNAGAYGYGFITDLFDTGNVDENGDPILVPENVLAITTHICAADSFEQSNIDETKKCPNDQTVGLLTALGLDVDTEHDGPEVHPHILDLMLVSEESACNGISDIEVNAGKTIFIDGDNVSPGDYDLTVKGNKVTVGNVPIDGQNLHNANLAAYASYNIHGIANSDGTITNLCLTDLTVYSL